MKKLMMILILPMSLILQGCDDTDVAVGAGIIGGIIIGTSIGHHHHCRGGYVRHCDTYRNHWGEYVRSCRRVYRPCAYRSQVVQPLALASINKNVDLSFVSAAEEVELTDAEKVAAKYDISLEASQNILNALSLAQSGQTSALEQIGLQRSDLESLARGAVLPAASIKSLSRNLKLNAGKTEEMIQKISAEVREARATR